jgi:two-component system, LuxR family, response regulator FixJ
MITISIVDDDDSVRQALKSLIDSVGFRAEVFGSGEEYLNSSQVYQTDCLIADVRMPGMSGLELQDRLNAAHLSIPVVFISAHDDIEARAQVSARAQLLSCRNRSARIHCWVQSRRVWTRVKR